MSLLVLTEDVIRREIERCTEAERAWRADRRRSYLLLTGAVVSNAMQLVAVGLSLHLIGRDAQLARWAGLLCAPLPTLLVLLMYARRHED